MVVTDTSNTKKKRRGPPFAHALLFSLVASVLIVGFQNCSVDLSSSTPGASTTGACGSPPAQALADIQPIVENLLKTSCAGCHGVTGATTPVQSGFYTPSPTADAADTAVQTFAYIQICARGGKAVATKIAPGGGHGGGEFTNAAFNTFLDTHF
ncbi:MAG: hypothetical protein U1E10_03665 [Bdellovibrionales bacterium]|nr:hypothetical protein [Bdellovibrionales bacterium]